MIIIYTIDSEDKSLLKNFAKIVNYIIHHPNGWTKYNYIFTEYDKSLHSDIDDLLYIKLVNKNTAEINCKMIGLSCYDPNINTIFINQYNWFSTSSIFIKHNNHLPFYKIQKLYQTYLINHEIGHALGKSHTMDCDNNMVSVMTQQTIYGNNNCNGNVYP